MFSFVRGAASLLTGNADDMPSHVRQISALCNRLQNSQSIDYDEKCDTLQELTLLCQQHQHDIGEYIDIFLILFEERAEARDDDFEMTSMVLNLLLACVSESADSDHSSTDKPPHVSNADYIVSADGGKYVSLLLGQLEQGDSESRVKTIKLLTLLAMHRTDKVQSVVLAHPMGVNRLVELLTEHEIIRNETLLLLEALTQDNENIKKIVAFEGCFEKLLQIIRSEGGAEGGIIVDDCLRLLCNLLSESLSNQNYFRELGCLNSLVPLLKITAASGNSLDVSMLSIVLSALRVVALVCSSLQHSEQKEAASTKTRTQLGASGVMQAVLELALSDYLPHSRRRECYRLIAMMIECNAKNQMLLASMSIQPLGGYAGVSSLFTSDVNVSLSQLQHDNQIDGELNALPTHTRFQIALKLFSHNRNVELKSTPQALQTPPKKSALLHLLDVCLINYANFAYFQSMLPDLHAAVAHHLDTFGDKTEMSHYQTSRAECLKHAAAQSLFDQSDDADSIMDVKPVVLQSSKSSNSLIAKPVNNTESNVRTSNEIAKRLLLMAPNSPFRGVPQSFRAVFLECSAIEHVLSCFLHDNHDAQMLLTSSFAPSECGSMQTTLQFPFESATNARSLSQPLAFGRALLACFQQLHQSNNVSDAMRLCVWFALRVTRYIVRQHNDVKQVLLQLPLEVFEKGSTQQSVLLPDILAFVLMSQSDARIQSAVLLLLVEWARDCDHALIAWFRLAPEHNPLFAHLIQLSASADSDTSLHSRGLATALLLVALRSRQSSSLLQQTLTPPLLFAIITQQIGLEKFKSNLDLLCASSELQSALTSTSSSSKFADFCPTDTLNNTSHDSSVQSVSQSNNIYDRSIAQFLDETRQKSDTVIMQLFATAAAEAFNQSNTGTGSIVGPSIVGSSVSGSGAPVNCNHNQEIERLNSELQRQRAENEKIRAENADLRAKSSNNSITSPSDSTVAQLQSEIEALKFHIEQFEQYADQQQKMYDEAIGASQTQATRIIELEQLNLQQQQQIEELHRASTGQSSQIHFDSNDWKVKFESCEADLVNKTTELSTMKNTLKELRKAMLESARAQQQLQQQVSALQSTASAPIPEVLPAPSVPIVATPTVQIAPSAPAPTYTTLNVNGTPIKVRDEQTIIESERFADLQRLYDELFQEHEDLLLLLAQEDLEKQQLVSQLEYYQKGDAPDFR